MDRRPGRCRAYSVIGRDLSIVRAISADESGGTRNSAATAVGMSTSRGSQIEASLGTRGMTPILQELRRSSGTSNATSLVNDIHLNVAVPSRQLPRRSKRQP